MTKKPLYLKRFLLITVISVILILGLGKIFLPSPIVYRSASDVPVLYESNTVRYDPDYASSNLASLSEPSQLNFYGNFPILDGATALYPLYAAIAKTAYRLPTGTNYSQYVHVSRTAPAFTALIEGQADLIFIAPPSDSQLAQAQSAGVNLRLTPIAKEAFVFLVNQNNPLNNLTVTQIQDIYQGKINNWRQVGGGSQSIIPFQREADSGSQTTMIKTVMLDKTLMTAPRERYTQFMSGLVDAVADYRNYEGALGYSFRFYTLKMVGNQQIKLLSVNGVAPTIANIQNDSYPFIIDVMAVSRADDNNVYAQQIIDWLLSPQGQTLIELVGYVPRH